MKTVRIGFSNMWGRDEDFTAEYFYRMFPFLKDHYDIQVVQHHSPDVMVYSVYGYILKIAPTSKRLLISGECGDHFAEGGKIARGVFEKGFYHYGLTCAWDNHMPGHLYLPQPLIMLNLYNNGWKSLIRDGSPPPEKTKFCDFIYSNPYSRLRRDFCAKLMKYRLVSCAGAVDRNCDDLVGTGYDKAGYLAKQAFQSKHRFSIAFENNYFPGYVTEKLTDPLVARSVPIYSGNPEVHRLFNTRSFINVDNFYGYDDAIDYIKYVDETPSVYETYLNSPPFVDNKIPEEFSDETCLNFFRKIFDGI